MASGAKRKTTMAKLNREHRLRERRLEKQAKRDARKLASAQGQDQPGGAAISESGPQSAEEPAPVDTDSLDSV
jgi:hypothetical protein